YSAEVGPETITAWSFFFVATDTATTLIFTLSLTTLFRSAARDGLRQKKFSAKELTQAHLAAMEKHRALNTFITETPEIALKQARSEEHTSELQSRENIVCRLLLEKKNRTKLNEFYCQRIY